MATYWVEEQGAHIRKAHGRLVVSRAGETIAEIPLHDCEQLVIRGNIQLSTPAMDALALRKTDVHFVTRTGQPRYRLMADDHKLAALRLRQYEATQSVAKTLDMVKLVVIGKLHNQRALLTGALNSGSEWAWGRASQASAARRMALEGIPRMMDGAGRAPDADSARGFEGKGAALYWPAFRECLKQDFGFAGRAYHPPPDPLNALLSFMYALLLKDVRAAISLTGLDAHIGFFHTVQYGRPSLVLDLMEEFRPLTDALVLRLINQDLIQLRDFDIRTTALAQLAAPEATTALAASWPPPVEARVARPITLRQDALRRVIEAYETQLGQRVRLPATGFEMSLRRAMLEQARLFARVLNGEAEAYAPYVVQRGAG